MKKTLKVLSDLRGISGYEYRINNIIKDMFIPYCDNVKIDNLGNIIAYKKGKTSNKKIMLEAHMDEIGLMVSQITKEGFIKFVNVGGVDSRILPSMEVVVHGKSDIGGVIGAKPPHLQTADEADKAIKISDMSIDTGLTYEELVKIISIGDSITINQSQGELLNDVISLKTMDDRASVCAILEVLKNIGEINADIYVSISVQEEVGLRGSKVSSFEIMPDMAIAIDVCHGITPDNSKDAFECGTGTVISKGPNIFSKLADKLIDICESKEIKYNIDVDGGDTGTDAWAIQVTRSGIPTALLSIPLKYMHTCVETLDFNDLVATKDLLLEFLHQSDNLEEDFLCF